MLMTFMQFCLWFWDTYWHNTPQNRWRSSRRLSRLWQNILLWNTANTTITELFFVFNNCLKNKIYSCTYGTPNLTEHCGYSFYLAPRAYHIVQLQWIYTLFQKTTFCPKINLINRWNRWKRIDAPDSKVIACYSRSKEPNDD